MRYLQLLSLMIVFSVGVVADSYYQCYKYNKSDLDLGVHNSFDYIYLAMPPKPSDTHMGYLLFIDKSREKILFLQSVACQRNKRKGLYLCGGECDAGEVNFDKDMGLKLDPKNPLVVEREVLGREEGLESEAIAIYQYNKPAKATKSPCPSAVTTIYHPTRDKESNKAHYICYVKKTYEMKNGTKSPKYSGCVTSKQLCRYESLYYFGHYTNDYATQKALKRCENGTPR